MLDNNDSVIVHVGDTNPHKKDESVSLGDGIQVNVAVNHSWMQPPTVEESTTMQEKTIVHIVQAVPSLADTTIAKIRQTGYSALQKNNFPTSDTELFGNYEMIEFSDDLKKRLLVGRNYPIYFTVEFDNIEQPLPLDLIVHIPLAIRGMFPNSFKIETERGNFVQVKETSDFDQNAYSGALIDFVATSVVV